MAVRRAIWISRLRRRRVDGRVLPLLAFLRDGWGWESIRGEVAKAVRRQAEVDRRSFNRPAPVRRDGDLIDNVEQRAENDAARAYLRFVVTANFWSAPDAGADPLAALLPLVDGLREAGLISSAVSPRELEGALKEITRARRDLGLSARQFADLVDDSDASTGQAGRVALLGLARSMRRVVRMSARSRLTGEWAPPSFNVLTVFGLNRTELRDDLRHSTGRPTAARLLAVAIANGIYVAMAMDRTRAPD